MIFREMEAGIITRLNVADVEASAAWYETKLGLVPDRRFDAPGWRQLNLNGVAGAAVGLCQSQRVGNGSSVLTFVVSDIEQARDALLATGIAVESIENPGNGVQLAFFRDADGNNLALRQSSDNHPSPRQIGDAG